jgi:hypothetical protein
MTTWQETIGLACLTISLQRCSKPLFVLMWLLVKRGVPDDEAAGAPTATNKSILGVVIKCIVRITEAPMRVVLTLMV